MTQAKNKEQPFLLNLFLCWQLSAHRNSRTFMSRKIQTYCRALQILPYNFAQLYPPFLWGVLIGLSFTIFHQPFSCLWNQIPFRSKFLDHIQAGVVIMDYEMFQACAVILDMRNPFTAWVALLQNGQYGKSPSTERLERCFAAAKRVKSSFVLFKT